MVDFEFNKDGDTNFVVGVEVVGVLDFVRFGILAFEGDPVFLLSMSFLDRDDIVVVYELSDCSFLRFPTVLWEAFGGEKAISIPSGE